MSVHTVWFTSDTHFYHKNILHLGKGRPFSSVEEMNEMIIKRWNERVSIRDTVYHLGDISFGSASKTLEVMARLNGQIFVIRGNHDNEAVLNKMIKGNQIVWWGPYKEITVSDQRLILFHFPILSWHRMHQGSYHLHGHCHGNLTFDNGPMMDVGVDAQAFAPISFEQVHDILSKAEFHEWDHHTR